MAADSSGSPYQFPAVHHLFNLLTSLEVHAGRVAEALDRCWSHHEAVPLPDDFPYRRLRQEKNRDIASVREADRARATEIDPVAVEHFDRYHNRLSDLRRVIDETRRAADNAAPDINGDDPASKRLSIRIRNVVGTIGGAVVRKHPHTEWDSPLIQARDTPERLRRQIPKLRQFHEEIRQSAIAKAPAGPSQVHVTNPVFALEPPPQPGEIVELRKALSLALSMSEYLIVLVRQGAELWEAEGSPGDMDWPQRRPARDRTIAGWIEAERERMTANGEDPMALSDQVTWSSWATLLDEYAPVYQQWTAAMADAVTAARACHVVARPGSPIDQQWVIGLIGELRALLRAAGPRAWRPDGLRVFHSDPPDLDAMLKPALDAVAARLNILVDLPFEVAEGGDRVTMPLVPPVRVLDFLAYLYDREAKGEDKHVPINRLPEEWQDPDFLMYCQDQGWVVFEVPYSAAVGTVNGVIGYPHCWVFAGQALQSSTLDALRKDLADPHPKYRVSVRLWPDGRRAVTEQRAHRSAPSAVGACPDVPIAQPAQEQPSPDAPDALPDLSEAERFTLIALLRGGHTDLDSRIKLDRLAAKAGYGTSASGNYKTISAGLSRRSLVQSKTGRNGGVWLTKGGVCVAKILVAKRS